MSCQRSKSVVSKTRPEAVLAYKAAPSVEYHTRSTEPVASDGRGSSMAEFPTCRQPIGDCAKTHQGNAAKPTAIETARTVALRHMDGVYCIPSARFIRRNELNLYSFVPE